MDVQDRHADIWLDVDSRSSSLLTYRSKQILLIFSTHFQEINFNSFCKFWSFKADDKKFERPKGCGYLGQVISVDIQRGNIAGLLGKYFTADRGLSCFYLNILFMFVLF